MFCSNCGSKLPEGARFCSVCGAKVLEAVRVDSSESAPLDFSDLPGAEAESKPAEAPVKTRVTFDWSNVIDEPQKRTVQDIKSPWSTTGSVDEREIAAEIKPSTDRSRTMSFIDVLKAEKEQAEAVKSIEETLAEDSKIEERPIIYTEVLDPGYLDGLGEEETETKPPELHIPPLYEDLDQPVVTPFDDMEEVPAEEPSEEPAAEEPAVVEIPAAEFELPVSEEPAAEVAEEPVFEEPEFEEPAVEEPETEVPEIEEPAAEEPVIEEPAAEAPENTHWFELPDFLKPREGETPFASIDEAQAEEIAEEPEAEEPAEEPATEELNMDDYLVEPEFEEPEFEEFEPEAPAFEEPVIEEPEFEEPAAEEPEAEEPVCEEPELDDMEVTEPEVEEPAVEEPVYEEPEFDYLAEEPAAEEPEIAEIEEPVAEEPQDDEDINALFTNAEDEYLDISTERGTVTRSTISFDPEEYDDEDEVEEVAETSDEVDEEPEVFEEPAAEEPEEEPAAEETAVDEESLFAEIEEEAPKKTGMTIAAPADKESEIEALKKRLAELMGTDWEEPQAIEKEDKLELEDLIDEPEEVSFEDEYLNISDEDLAVEEPEVELPEVEEPEIELPEIEEPEVELPEIEEPEVELPEIEEPEIELPEVEEPEIELPEIEELEVEVPEIEEPEIEIPALEEEVPAVEEPEIELPEIEEEPAEKKPASIDDYLAAILEQEAAPVVAASEIAAQEHELGGTLDDYLEVPAAEEPEIELPEFEGEVPSVELPAEEPEIELPEFEGEIPSVELPAEEPEEIEIPAIEEEAPETEVSVPEVKASDALTIEELEKDIFGNQPSEDARAEETKKIDKFYTLYRKNEEFQRLLDEEYNKLKAAGGPAPEQILPDPEPPATAAKNGKMIEDATIYQEFEIPAEALAEAEAKAKEARENAPVKFEKDDAKVAAAVAGAATAAGIASTVKKAEKENDAPEVEYEEVDKGGGCLTALAVIIAILLVILLAIILLLNFAPDSGISIKIDSFIENITSHFTAIEVIGKQILL